MAYAFKDTERLKKARERFKIADDADTDQANREKEDLAMYAGDQWPADIKLARMGQQPTNGMPAIPSRPTLVINKMREPIRQVQNEIRDADIGIEITPADDFGDLGITPDDTEITLREGLLRRIIRDTNGQQAWNWAGDRADIAGRGYFGVLTRYLPGKTNDQEVYLWRIYNQNAVKGDPGRTEPDGSDADYWFIGTWVNWDKFKAEYPYTSDGKTKNPFVDMSEGDFATLAKDYPSWVKASENDGKNPAAVFVVDYWYYEYSSRSLVTVADGAVYWDDEVPEGAEEIDRRTVVEKKPKCCKIGGGIVELEMVDGAGPDLPIVETIGEELHPYDDKRRVEGMVRNAIDSQRGFNYMVSKQVEQIGLTPIPPLQLDPDAIDGYEQYYNALNTRTLPWVPYRTYNDEGKELREPHRLNVEPNVMAISQSIALFDQTIKSTTAVPDPTLGNVDPTLKSGRAIRETVANAKGSTSNYLSNRIVSIRRACEIANNLLYPIYGAKPGRLVRIMTGEGKSETLMIGDPSQQDQDAQQQAALQQKAAKVAKLTEDAKFNIALKVTKNFETRRQQENSMLGELIGQEPQLMTWFGDLYLASSDMPNRKQMAERAKAMLAPPIQQMEADKESGQPVPPAAQAKIAQLQEQVQHAEAAIKELAQEADGKRLDAQVKLQLEQMRGQLEIQKATLQYQQAIELQRMQDATSIRVAEVKAGIEADKLKHEADALDRDQAHEAALQHASEQHEAEMATRQMAHAAAVGEGQADRQEDQAEADRQFQAGQADADRAAQMQTSQQPEAE